MRDDVIPSGEFDQHVVLLFLFWSTRCLRPRLAIIYTTHGRLIALAGERLGAAEPSATPGRLCLIAPAEVLGMQSAGIPWRISRRISEELSPEITIVLENLVQPIPAVAEVLLLESNGVTRRRGKTCDGTCVGTRFFLQVTSISRRDLMDGRFESCTT